MRTTRHRSALLGAGTGAHSAAAIALATLITGCAGLDTMDLDTDEAQQDIGVDDAAGLVTSVGLSGTDGASLGAYMTHHPVKVRLKILPTTPLADHHVLVGLAEKQDPDAPMAPRRTCVLADFKASYGVDPGEQAEPVQLDAEAIVPADCLTDGAPSGTFNLWVGVDPLLEGQDPGWSDYNTQFFNAAALDMNGDNRNILCTGPQGEAKCIMDIHLTASGGHDLEMASAEPESHVGVIDAACSLDATRPLFMLNDRLRIFGSAAHDGDDEGGEPANALDAAGGPGAEVSIHYAICPRGEPGADGASPCAAGTSYVPLKIGQGEDGLADSAPVTRMAADEPLHVQHALFAAPGGEACGRLVGSSSASEDWSGHATYNLRACAAAPFAEAKNGGDAESDNCVVEPVQIVMTAPAGNEATSLSFRRTYDSSFGGSVAKVTVSAGTDSTLDLSGAKTHNWAKADLGGWFSKSLINIWADGAAYVSVTGSHVNAGVEVFGTKKWGYSQKLNEIHYTAPDQVFSAQKCMSYVYGLPVLNVTVSGCIQGQAGLRDIKLDVFSKDGSGGAPFASATRIGQASAGARPFANLNLTLSASASVVVARGGVTGSVTLVGVSLPSKADLRWGLVANQSNNPSLVVTANVSSNLAITTMSGSVRAWADVLLPAWCGRWIKYPCFSWRNVFNRDIAAWSGTTTTIPVLNTSGQWTLL